MMDTHDIQPVHPPVYHASGALLSMYKSSTCNSRKTSVPRPKDVKKSMLSELKRLKSTIQRARDDLQDACDSDKVCDSKQGIN